jgi:hypothetical protein
VGERRDNSAGKFGAFAVGKIEKRGGGHDGFGSHQAGIERDNCDVMGTEFVRHIGC